MPHRSGGSRPAPETHRYVRVELLQLGIATTVGLNIAARAGASPTELGRIVARIEAEIRSWTTR